MTNFTVYSNVLSCICNSVKFTAFITKGIDYYICQCVFLPTYCKLKMPGSVNLPQNAGELEKQIDYLDSEIQELKDALQNKSESSERHMKEQIETKGQTVKDHQSQLQEFVEEHQRLRRSERQRTLTEKMLVYQREEAKKREKRFTNDQWKIQAHKVREQLKSDITESELGSLIDMLEKGREEVMSIYVEIRNQTVPSTEVRRRVDVCEAVTADIIKILHSTKI